MEAAQTVPVAGVSPAGALLAATCLSTLLVNVNSSAITVLLPSIAADLGTSMSLLQWAVSGYSLVAAAFIVTAGVLGDMYGRRLVFMAGLVVWGAACVVIALSVNGGMLVAGRLLQGLGSSAVVAAGLSILAAATTGTATMRAVALWGGAAAAGSALGPFLGGLIAQAVGWQGIFWIDAVLAAVTAVVARSSISESRDETREHSLDVGGMVLIAVTLVLFILAISNASSWGWASAATIGCLAGAAVAAVLFVLTERRVRSPLIELDLLRNRLLVASCVCLLIGTATISGVFYVLTLYFQSPFGLDLSPFLGGLATLPGSVALIAVSLVVTALATKLGTRTVIVSGFVITAAAAFVLTAAAPTWSYWPFALALALAGAGLAMGLGPSASVASASVDASKAGAVSGISNMARYVGASLGAAAAAGAYIAGGVADLNRSLAEQGADAVTESQVSTAISAQGAAALDAASQLVPSARTELADTFAAAVTAGLNRSVIVFGVAAIVAAAVALLVGRLRPARDQPAMVEASTAVAATTAYTLTVAEPVSTH